ncbi:MAG: hypothetical protein ACE5GA_04680 [Candidatus Zixiibacteriota bacterium]
MKSRSILRGDLTPGFTGAARALALIIPAFIASACLAPSDAAHAQERGRIYGKVHTVDGDILEGFIRWDKNEGCWDNVLDGTKDRPRIRERGSRKRYRDRKKRSLFGIGLLRSSSAQSGIAFGHIESLEPTGDNSAILNLKSGEEVEFEGGSTDIGDDIREIVIEDKREGELELAWDDIESIEFSQAPSTEQSVFGDRLYGSLTTRRGDEFVGYIGWDYDESFVTDVLDGYTNGRKRKLRFKRISSIERRGSGGALVTMTDGKELRLEDSNDVDSRNNGIVVSDIKLGRIVVGWGQFDLLELSAPPDGVAYDMFDGGKPISGSVTTDEGDTFTGEIIWDADEEYTWEILDGEDRGIQYDIFFSNISSIVRERRGATVNLIDGRSISLRNSNDIDDDNKGIYVRATDGTLEKIDWDYFAKVEFKQ